MNCTQHSNQPAVAYCSLCFRGLCRTCARKYPQVLCDSCFQAHRTQIIRTYWNRFLWIFLWLSAGLLLLFPTKNGLLILVGSLFFAGLPCSWSIIRTVTPPEPASRLKKASWMFGKFCFSFLIGIFVLPYRIIQTVRDLHQIRRSTKKTR